MYPQQFTEVEKSAVRDSANRPVQRSLPDHEPMAAALGIGIDVEEPVGNMIIDIGGGTTVLPWLPLLVLYATRVSVFAGDEFTLILWKPRDRYHSLLIGERTAEQIKIQVGAAMKDLDNPPDDIPVNGRDLVTGIPKQVNGKLPEVAEALDKSIFKIEEAILKHWKPHRLNWPGDIYRRGLYITGAVRFCGDWIKASGQDQTGACGRWPVEERGAWHGDCTEALRQVPICNEVINSNTEILNSKSPFRV